MKDLAFWSIDDVVSLRTDLHAEIRIFPTVAKAFIQSTHLIIEIPGHAQARTGHRLQGSFLVHRRMVSGEAAVEMIKDLRVLSDHQAGVLNRLIVRVEQFPTDDAGARSSLERFKQCLEEAVENDRVVVQQQQIITLCQLCPVVVAAGETSILFVGDDADVSSKAAQQTSGFVARGIVDDDDFM